MSRKEHWNRVYAAKGPEDVSWHQDRPSLSLRLIENSGMPLDGGVIDVGGGASALAHHLVRAGYSHVAVLDLSAAALDHARQRAGAEAGRIEWIEADVTAFTPARAFGVWHDRAVFHFLTDRADRAKYVEALNRALRPGGHVILATFSPDGPAQCSGLPVRRYDAASIGAELGDGFELLEHIDETHLTPWQAEQQFRYFHFRKRSGLP